MKDRSSTPLRDQNQLAATTFCAGAELQLKGGGPKLIAGEYHPTKGRRCDWVFSGDLKTRFFEESMLRPYEDPVPSSIRLVAVSPSYGLAEGELKRLLAQIGTAQAALLADDIEGAKVALTEAIDGTGAYEAAQAALEYPIPKFGTS
jgi:uncharacterized protein YodC (DUF2158 family)